MRGALALLLGSALALALVGPAAGDPPAPPISPVPADEFAPVATPPQAVTTSAPRPVKPRPAPRPKVRPAAPSIAHRGATTRSISGLASWYCERGRSSCFFRHPDVAGYDAYAAAGPALRAAICGVQSCTSWRGRVVLVNGHPVRLVDWCQCHWHEPIEKLIDLYHDVYALTGGEVTIRW